ncbi:hypothetical protein HDV63DRAFT_253361 [Trichoderma sp. SZMC 28014]
MENSMIPSTNLRRLRPKLILGGGQARSYPRTVRQAAKLEFCLIRLSSPDVSDSQPFHQGGGRKRSPASLISRIRKGVAGSKSLGLRQVRASHGKLGATRSHTRLARRSTHEGRCFWRNREGITKCKNKFFSMRAADKRAEKRPWQIVGLAQRPAGATVCTCRSRWLLLNAYGGAPLRNMDCRCMHRSLGAGLVLVHVSSRSPQRPWPAMLRGI